VTEARKDYIMWSFITWRLYQKLLVWSCQRRWDMRGM